MFFPPELAESMQDAMNSDQSLGASTDLMRQLYFQRSSDSAKNKELDRKLVSLVIDHARKVIAHPSRPMQTLMESYERIPWGELDLEESLDEDPRLNDSASFRVTMQTEKPFTCVTMLDSSSSMSGDKHLLASIAAAVLLLEVPVEQASLILFASDAKVMKPLKNRERVEDTILRFLKTEARGFTNIAKGLEAGLREIKERGATKRKVGLLASDGRSTEGKDPVEIAKEYDALVVLHLHGPGSHITASQEIAQAGRGPCLEVERFEELPRRLYDAIRLLARM